MKKTIFTLLALAIVASSVFAGYGAPITIKRAAKPAKIDGVSDASDPWTSTWVKMTTAKTANTTTTMTAQFQLAYDNTNLYLICQQAGNLTEDTAASAIANSYERDCFEVFVKLDTASENADFSYETDGTYQVRQVRASVFPDRFDFAGKWKEYVGFGLQIKQVDGATGFTQEWQMPWTMLSDSGKVDKWSKKDFKFEIQAADNTTGAAGGRTQQMYWQDGSDNQWHNTSTFSLVKLTDAVDVKQVAALNNNVVTMNTLVADVLTLSTTVKSLSIYNVTGQVVVDNLKNVNTVNLSNLSSGIYFVRTNNMTTKIVKR
jgi:hypothetical protein